MPSTADYGARVLAYLKTHDRYYEWNKEQAVLGVINLLLHDIGAAQAFLDELGVKVNLYEMHDATLPPIDGSRGTP